MRRLLLVMLVLGSGVADAAPLCRDSKGLFTPCPPETRAQREKRAKVAAARPVTTEATVARAARPRKAPLVGRAKLCRDTKGLFTPCA